MTSFSQLDHLQQSQYFVQQLNIARELANTRAPSAESDKEIGERAELAWIRLYKHDRDVALKTADQLFAKPGRFTALFSERAHSAYSRMHRQKVDLTRHPMLDPVLLARLATTTADNADSKLRDTTEKIMARRYMQEMEQQPAETAVKALGQSSKYADRNISDLLTIIASQSNLALRAQPDDRLDALALGRAGTALNKLMPERNTSVSEEKQVIWQDTFRNIWNAITLGICNAANGGGQKVAVFSLSTYMQAKTMPLMEYHSSDILNAAVKDLRDAGQTRSLVPLYQMFRKIAAGRPVKVDTTAMPAVEADQPDARRGSNNLFSLPVGDVTEIAHNKRSAANTMSSPQVSTWWHRRAALAQV